MNGRAGLIERAAERLRQGITETAAATVMPHQASRAAPTPSAPPLSRKVTLDRGYLAKIGILMPWTSTARVVDEFRIIKRNLIASWPVDMVEPASRGPNIVMVTSARPREGKTFNSVNLALAFAAEEHSTTVLIDADTVRGDTAKALHIPTQPGLTDVLSGRNLLSEALVQTDIPSLVVLPPGAPGPRVPELLSGPAPKAMFAEIAECYRNPVIIMDTPPCLASSDPAALAMLASQIVFVVEAEHTQRAEVESALSLISGCARISFVLNLVPSGGEHFGAYSYQYQPD